MNIIMGEKLIKIHDIKINLKFPHEHVIICTMEIPQRLVTFAIKSSLTMHVHTLCSQTVTATTFKRKFQI